MLADPQDDLLDKGPGRAAPGAERFCAATGAVKPVEEMIRFVVSPDGHPVPDLKRRLPGRGLWITGTRAAVQMAIARKTFSRGFKRSVSVPDDLAETTERLLERAALDSLAMAHKSRRVATGFGKVETTLGNGGATALVHASDAAPDGVRKLAAVLRRTEQETTVPTIAAFSSAQLDLAFGRSNVIHAALLTGRESKAFLARYARLERFRNDPADNSGARRGPKDRNRNG